MLARGMRRAVGGLGTAPMALAVGNRNLSWLPGFNIGSPHVLQELAERTGHIPSVRTARTTGPAIAMCFMSFRFLQWQPGTAKAAIAASDLKSSILPPQSQRSHGQ